jgi:hypothetical protein
VLSGFWRVGLWLVVEREKTLGRNSSENGNAPLRIAFRAGIVTQVDAGYRFEVAHSGLLRNHSSICVADKVD